MNVGMFVTDHIVELSVRKPSTPMRLQVFVNRATRSARTDALDQEITWDSKGATTAIWSWNWRRVQLSVCNPREGKTHNVQMVSSTYRGHATY